MPKKRKPYNVWWCNTCGIQSEFDLDGIKKHLTETHKLDLERLQVKKTMVMHLDGDTFYKSSYACETQTDPVIHLQNETLNLRSKESMMYRM